MHHCLRNNIAAVASPQNRMVWETGQDIMKALKVVYQDDFDKKRGFESARNDTCM